MKKLNVALLSGGKSSEREVSLSGGEQVYQALDKEKYHVVRYDPETDLSKLVAAAEKTDIALIILHGPFGEDGTIQGLLDLLDIPYQGSGVLGSALSMNKIAAKGIYHQNDLPTPACRILGKADIVDVKECVCAVGLPMVVKPGTGGSSIGMSLVRKKEELPPALEKAFIYDDAVILESYVKGVEITGSVIGNDKLTALPIVEIIPDEKYDFFEYDAKYTAGETREICPARINDALTRKAQYLAMASHKVLFCRGYSRTDMIYDGNEIYILETNTIPGMTETSLLPLAAKTAGMSFSRLLDRLIELGLEGKVRT
jgi:D-alanine-D-alanine ligase